MTTSCNLTRLEQVFISRILAKNSKILKLAKLAKISKKNKNKNKKNEISNNEIKPCECKIAVVEDEYTRKTRTLNNMNMVDHLQYIFDCDEHYTKHIIDGYNNDDTYLDIFHKIFDDSWNSNCKLCDHEDEDVCDNHHRELDSYNEKHKDILEVVKEDIRDKMGKLSRLSEEERPSEQDEEGYVLISRNIKRYIQVE